MPIQDVSTILEKCGDIDDDIRQLMSLKLTFQQSGGEAVGKAAAEASGGGGAGAFRFPPAGFSFTLR